MEFVFGSHPDDLLDSTFDYLIKNPGVPIHHKYCLLYTSFKNLCDMCSVAKKEFV